MSLAGLTPGMSRGHHTAALVQLVESLPAEDLHIVFGHNPDFSIALADHAPVALALAGHTHGGQVALPFFGPPYTKSPLPRSLASGLGDYRRRSTCPRGSAWSGGLRRRCGSGAPRDLPDRPLY